MKISPEKRHDIVLTEDFWVVAWIGQKSFFECDGLKFGG
jgi:hypothetical protein